MNLIDLNMWRHSIGARCDRGSSGTLTISDTQGLSWQVVGISSPEIKGRIQLTIEARPCNSADSWLCVHHAGGHDLAFLSPTGLVKADLRAEHASVRRLSNQFFKFCVTWDNLTDFLYLGCARERPITSSASVMSSLSVGSGSAQWEIRAISVEILPPISASPPKPNQGLVYVDVGAWGGIGRAWEDLGQRLVPVLFEPQAEEAARIQRDMRTRFPNAVVIATAVSDIDGIGKIFITSDPGCVSMRRPNPSIYERYVIAEKFKVQREVEIPTARYDTLVQHGEVPPPDVLKIDAQGMEYEILKGFGSLLDGVVAIELEGHFAQVYEGERNIGEIVALLDSHGFALRAMRPNDPVGWGHELIEINAFFLRREGQQLDSIPFGAEKLRTAANIWNVW